MLILLFVLLMLSLGCCTDDLTTVDVGKDVTLTCTRQNTLSGTSLHWIRLVSGNFLEFLGGTPTFDYEGVHKTPHTTAEQGPGTFLLHIHGTQLNDTGLYFCVKVTGPNITLLQGTFLRVKGPKPDITAVIQPPSDPGDSEALQCSVLSENEACPGESSVYWFRAGSDESQPSLVYIHGNSGDECETSPGAQSAQECLYSLSENDAGTYYCAVATCGEILFGNGMKQQGTSVCSQTTTAVTALLCAVLVVFLLVTAVLIYSIKTNKCDCHNTADTLQNTRGAKNIQQRDKDVSIYSAAVFTAMKSDRGAVKDAKAAAERGRIYAAVKAFGLN